MSTRRQRTFEVDGEKITIITTVKTSMGNKVGFTVKINGEKFFKAALTADEAEDLAYVSWVRRHAPPRVSKFAPCLRMICYECSQVQFVFAETASPVCINCLKPLK